MNYNDESDYGTFSMVHHDSFNSYMEDEDQQYFAPSQDEIRSISTETDEEFMDSIHDSMS